MDSAVVLYGALSEPRCNLRISIPRIRYNANVCVTDMGRNDAFFSFVLLSSVCDLETCTQRNSEVRQRLVRSLRRWETV